MKKSSSSYRQRSLARRLLAPLVLSLGVLGGGAWGVHHFTTDTEQASDAGASIIAHTAPSASDELKQLFASPPPQKQKKGPPPMAVENRAATDRYSLAPAMPPKPAESASEAKPLASAASKSKVESTSALLGNRYATVTLQTPKAPEPKPLAAEPQPVKKPIQEPKGDVARGQEPETFNPLRASLKSVDSSTPTPKPRPATAQQAAAAKEMFGESQPLARQAAASPPSARYPATKPSAPLPAIDFGPSATAASPPRPAPAYELQQQPTTASQEHHLSATPLRANLGSPTDVTPTPGLTNTPGTGRPGEKLLEGMQSPLITIQKLAPEEIQVGKRCSFAIRVQNTGQRTAQNVQIHDEVPFGTELLGTSPRATVSGSQVVWDIGALSVGEERIVELELIPTEEGELGSVATVTFATQASAKARCTRPKLALRLSSQAQVHAGQEQVVQVEVSNPGTGDATNVMLLETIPSGVSHEAGPTVEFEVGTLKPGEVRRLELVLTAEQAGKVNNRMTARADANLQAQASCQFEVIAPDLRLTVDGPKKRYLERPATYQVTINNPGTASAKEVQLVTKLPKGLQFVSANNMGEYDPGAHSVHWSLAELPANERGTVEIVALPIEVGEHTMQIATKARQGLEDRTEARVMVDGIVSLMFEVVDVESPIEIGGETTYEIRVTNQGSKPASNVQVAAILDQGMRAISGQGESRHSIQGERVIFAPLRNLAPKANAVFRIQAQGLRAGDQRVRVQITSDEVQQPITEEVSTRVYADQ